MMLEANPLFAAADESNEFLLDVEVETAQINDSPSTASFSIAGRKVGCFVGWLVGGGARSATTLRCAPTRPFLRTTKCTK